MVVRMYGICHAYGDNTGLLDEVGNKRSILLLCGFGVVSEVFRVLGYDVHVVKMCKSRCGG